MCHRKIDVSCVLHRRFKFYVCLKNKNMFCVCFTHNKHFLCVLHEQIYVSCMYHKQNYVLCVSSTRSCSVCVSQTKFMPLRAEVVFCIMFHCLLCDNAVSAKPTRRSFRNGVLLKRLRRNEVATVASTQKGVPKNQQMHNLRR